MALLGSYSELRNLIHRGHRSNAHVTPSMRVTLKVWDAVHLKVENQIPNLPKPRYGKIPVYLTSTLFQIRSYGPDMGLRLGDSGSGTVDYL